MLSKQVHLYSFFLTCVNMDQHTHKTLLIYEFIQYYIYKITITEPEFIILLVFGNHYYSMVSTIFTTTNKHKTLKRTSLNVWQELISKWRIRTELFRQIGI